MPVAIQWLIAALAGFIIGWLIGRALTRRGYKKQCLSESNWPLLRSPDSSSAG
jgi:hypothetical protein